MEEVYPGVYLLDEKEEGGGWRELTWFVDHDAGGILVNPQDFDPPVAKAVDRLGGAHFIFVTDGRSAGDACKFKERYNARIVIHKDARSGLSPCTVEDAFESDFSLAQGLRVLVGAGAAPGAAMLYVMKDRGYLFPGNLMAVDGARERPILRLREGGDPAEVKRALLHLRALRFGAVMPSHTRHPTQGHIAGQGEAIADALLHGGFFPR